MRSARDCSHSHISSCDAPKLQPVEHNKMDEFNKVNEENTNRLSENTTGEQCVDGVIEYNDVTVHIGHAISMEIKNLYSCVERLNKTRR